MSRVLDAIHNRARTLTLPAVARWLGARLLEAAALIPALLGALIGLLWFLIVHVIAAFIVGFRFTYRT